jgi:purine nucleosidase
MADRLPLILDVDTGIDDALAVLYAGASPDVELVAVTCVAGNVPLEAVTANTLAILELAGRGDVTVMAGAAVPLVKPLRTTEETHGPRGIGHATLPPARRSAVPGSAAGAIVEIARGRPGEVHLVTLGPLTNLALALGQEPGLPRLLGGWTLMGGAYGVPGNTTPTSEWNIHVDPDAAKACLAAWDAGMGAAPFAPLPVAMGLDVTERARLTPAEVAAVARRAGADEADAAALTAPETLMQPRGSVAANRVLRYVVDSLRFYFEFHARHDGLYGAFIHDPFAVAATLEPGLVTTRRVYVDVEAGPGLAHGMTVADWRGITGRRPNLAVAVDGDASGFLERWIERVGGLARSTPTAGG